MTTRAQHDAAAATTHGHAAAACGHKETDMEDQLHKDLRILLCILMARLDNRVEISEDEAAKARQWLAEHETEYVTGPASRLEQTFFVEMRYRSRTVIPG